jgi:F-type H+/Na+-transporting ATPase subunit beta
MSAGIIRSVRDLVVLVQFDEDGPDIGELVLVQNQNRSVLLVDHLNPGNIAVCLSVFSDRTIQKNMAAERTGQGIEVPVGGATIGRVLDALGRPLDGLQMPDPNSVKYKNVMQWPPHPASFNVAKPEILETGIKVIDFFTPFVKGRKIGIIGGAGVGKTVLTMELIHNVAKSGEGFMRL